MVFAYGPTHLQTRTVPRWKCLVQLVRDNMRRLKREEEERGQGSKTHISDAKQQHADGQQQFDPDNARPVTVVKVDKTRGLGPGAAEKELSIKQTSPPTTRHRPGH